MLKDGRKANTIILIHGAWSGSWSWTPIVAPLRASGLTIVVVQLPLVSLKEDAAAVRQILMTGDEPAVLVGHGYGGVVVTEVGAEPKVSGLVYVAALVPDVGDTLASLTGLAGTALALEGLASEVPQFLRSAEGAASSSLPAPRAFDAVHRLVTAAAWKKTPSWYVLAERDRIIPAELQQAMAERVGALVIRVAADHPVMANATSDLCEIILEAAHC